MNYKMVRMLPVLAIIVSIAAVLLFVKSPVKKDNVEGVESREEEQRAAQGERPQEVQEEEVQEAGVQQEGTQDIFADSAVVDLGNHKVAYLTTSDKLERYYEYENWIVIQKLNQVNSFWNDDQTLFIPAEGTITAIEADNFGFQIREEIGQEVLDVQIPICFQPDMDVVELRSQSKRAVLTAQPDTSSIPETVWTEKVGADEENYEISFERISIPYVSVTSAMGGEYADYRLTVRDAEGKTVQEIILTNSFLLYEDVYWLIDIDGDRFQDLVFCVEHVQGQENSSTSLMFLVWNKDKKLYEEKPLPETDVEWPIWNEQERALTFTTEELGNYWVRGDKMYHFDDGDWQLYAELIPSNGEETPVFQDGYEKEIYYKDLDYYYIEKRYESDKMIGESIMEEAPYGDEQSMWSGERDGDQELFPRGASPWGVDVKEP